MKGTGVRLDFYTQVVSFYIIALTGTLEAILKEAETCMA